MSKNKKEDSIIKKARIQEYILNEYIKYPFQEEFFKETALKFKVEKEFIFCQVKVLGKNGYIKVYPSKRGAPVITSLEDKGKTYKDELVEKAEDEVKKEKSDEKRAKTGHTSNKTNILKGI